MIVHVGGPAGCGKLHVVEGGLQAMGLRYQILRCDVIDPLMDVDSVLASDVPVVILTEVDRMRDDFRAELMGRARKCEDKTFWVMETLP